jgi:hypothetical protein
VNRKQSALALVWLTLSAAAVVQVVSPPEPTQAETRAALAAQPSEEAPATTPVEAEVAPDAAPATARAVDRAPLSPMHRDIGAALKQEKALVEELNRRFLAAPLPTERIAIQKEIEAAKKNGMIAVFEIQLRYAEAEGKTTAVEQLRTTLEAIRNPKTPAAIGG